MTAPEHDPAVTMWATVDRITGEMVADLKRNEARAAGFGSCCVNVGKPECGCVPGSLTGPLTLLQEWHWDGRLPLFGPAPTATDMPDRWEGDDS